MASVWDDMTVAELRKYAREHGITLSAGINKQGILDRIADGGDGRPTGEEIADLTALFSRDGFTDGYLTGDRNGMIAVDNKKLTEGNPASEAANKRAEERYVLCDRKTPLQL